MTRPVIDYAYKLYSSDLTEDAAILEALFLRFMEADYVTRDEFIEMVEADVYFD